MALLAAPGVDLKAEQDFLSQGDEHVGWLLTTSKPRNHDFVPVIGKVV
jgi:hypothetical protein